jgi:hypothetical protein
LEISWEDYERFMNSAYEAVYECKFWKKQSYYSIIKLNFICKRWKLIPVFVLGENKSGHAKESLK